MGRAAVFPEVDSLPGSQREAPVRDGDGEVHGGQGGANVRRHVIVSFDRMPEERITVGHETGEESFQITAHVRVGIFLDQQGSRSVTEMEGQQPALPAILRHPGRHLLREFV